MTEINKEIAFQVILPKLKSIANEFEIKSAADLRKQFNIKHDESISAAKFQEWLDDLEIKFVKKVVVLWPKPARPSGRPAADPLMSEEEEVDDEMSHDFPPTSQRSMQIDAFNQMP